LPSNFEDKRNDAIIRATSLISSFQSRDHQLITDRCIIDQSVILSTGYDHTTAININGGSFTSVNNPNGYQNFGFGPLNREYHILFNTPHGKTTHHTPFRRAN